MVYSRHPVPVVGAITAAACAVPVNVMDAANAISTIKDLTGMQFRFFMGFSPLAGVVNRDS
jgi:hypothetical protein